MTTMEKIIALFTVLSTLSAVSATLCYNCSSNSLDPDNDCEKPNPTKYTLECRPPYGLCYTQRTTATTDLRFSTECGSTCSMASRNRSIRVDSDQIKFFSIFGLRTVELTRGCMDHHNNDCTSLHYFRTQSCFSTCTVDFCNVGSSAGRVIRSAVLVLSLLACALRCLW